MNQSPFIPEDTHDPLVLFLADLARAADLCLKPYRHALRFAGDPPSSPEACSDCVLLIEARDSDGSRVCTGDLELEIYRSGDDLNLMLGRVHDDQAPLLWHGSHPVWMHPASGERCERPPDGAPLEALCRRIRASLVAGDAGLL